MPKTPTGSNLARLLARYSGRTLIVHAGFPGAWLGELLKQPGGGGHFRVDRRNVGRGRETPVEWLVARHLQGLELPLPLIVKITPEALYVRHLTRGGEPVHPSEIYWLIAEIEERFHARLLVDGASLRVEKGIDPDDNEARSFLDSIGEL